MQYTIEPTRMGLYVSIDSKGNHMVTGLTEEAVKYVTDNIHIPVLQGTFDGYTSEPRSSVVGGKLQGIALASVVELVYTRHLKCLALMGLRVQVPPEVFVNMTEL